MIHLGSEGKIISTRRSHRLPIVGRPEAMPKIPNGHTVVCVLKCGGEKYAVACPSLEHMQSAYQHYRTAIIEWRHTGAFVMPLRSTT